MGIQFGLYLCMVWVQILVGHAHIVDHLSGAEIVLGK